MKEIMICFPFLQVVESKRNSPKKPRGRSLGVGEEEAGGRLLIDSRMDPLGLNYKLFSQKKRTKEFAKSANEGFIRIICQRASSSLCAPPFFCLPSLSPPPPNNQARLKGWVEAAIK